jgi:hypothetical protein
VCSSDLTAPTNFNFVGADYARQTGLRGGPTKRLQANYPNAEAQRHNRHDAVFVQSPATPTTTRLFWHTVNNPVTTGFVDSTEGGDFGFRSWAGMTQYVSAGGQPVGLLGVSRAEPSTASVFINSTLLSRGIGNEMPGAGELYWFAGSTGTLTTDARLSFVSAGDAIDLQKLAARVTALMTTIGETT